MQAGIRIVRLARLNNELDGRAHFFIDFDIYKLRDENDIIAVLLQVAFRQRKSFNCLVDRNGSDRLDLSVLIFPENSGNRTCHGGST